jgi:hypothetical protein
MVSEKKNLKQFMNQLNVVGIKTQKTRRDREKKDEMSLQSKLWAYTSADGNDVRIMPCICDDRDEWIAAQFRSFQDVGRNDGYVGVPIFARSLSEATNRALDAVETVSRSGERDSLFLIARLRSEEECGGRDIRTTTEDTYVYDSSAYVLSPRRVSPRSDVLHACLNKRGTIANEAPMPQDIPVFIDGAALNAFVRDTADGASLVA